MNLIFENSQLVLFSPGIIIPDKLKIANIIKEKYLPELDGDPVILPIPEDAPDEIMRIQMNSKDKKYTLLIAKNRVDLFFNYNEDFNYQGFPYLELFDKFGLLFQFLIEQLNIQITRAANVLRIILDPGNIPAADLLAIKYFRDSLPLKNPHEMEVHYLIREILAGFEVNKWTRIISGHKQDKTDMKGIISILIDINTLAERTYKFDRTLIKKFLEESSRDMKLTIAEHSTILFEG